MTEKLKNAIKKAIITGTIAAGAGGGAYQTASKLNCDFTIPFEDEQICITQEQKDAIGEGLKPNVGFGGVRFGGE